MIPKKNQRVEDVVGEIIKKQSEHAENKIIKSLVADVVRLKKENKAILQIQPVKTFSIEPKYPNGKGEAVAIAVASDWHVGEVVKAKKVNGLNEYNPDIAKKRATQFFQNTLKLVRKEEQCIHINTLVLALLGDFISGNIHEELLANTAMPPVEEVLFAQGLIASGIEFLLENSNLNLVIPCNSGNHSRITKKIHISNEQGNSLEYYMYWNLKKYFIGNKRVTFVIAEGYHNYLDVLGHTLRFHHGHAIQYGGGIGGVTIPATKAIRAWNTDKKIYQDFFGHFHSYLSHQHWTLNGSMIGYSPFAIQIKAEYERPQQAFCLIDAEKGRTTQNPILFNI